MPLSEYERRVLSEIEFALATDSRCRRYRRRLARGYVALALLSLLAGGLITLTTLNELPAAAGAVLTTVVGVLIGTCGSAVWAWRRLDPSLAGLGRSPHRWGRVR
jgi:hypothetical protein